MADNTHAKTEEREIDLYEFEFRFLPFLAKKFSEDKFDPRALVTEPVIRMMVESNCDRCDWNWDDFKADVIQREGCVMMAVYTFPEPYRVPLAKFGAIIVQPGWGTEYYTLEKSFNSWMLCSQNGELHNNFGDVEEPSSVEEFADILAARILKQDTNKTEQIC